MFAIRRRKSFFTLLLILSCLIYFNWFLKISDWKQPNSESNNFLNYDNGIFPEKDYMYNFEKLNNDLYLNFDKINAETNNGNGQFVLLTANKKSLFVKKRKYTQAMNQKLNNDELNSVFKILFQKQAFLLDVDILKSLKIHGSQPNSLELLADYNYNVFNFYKLNDFINDDENKNKTPVLISFGVLSNSVESLNKEMIENLNEKCQFLQSNGNYIQEPILTNLYILCKKLIIQISVVYERANFYWIGNDNLNLAQTKYFGDIPRAINKFDLALISDDNSNIFKIPANVKRFLFDYEHSAFIECNRILAQRNLKILGSKYNQNEKKNKVISPVIQHLSESLESFYKHFWLAGGTLLGWYRDCGIIPHTQDVDLAIWSHEYDNRIKKHFLGNKIVRVWGTLGMVNDSYEFRLYNDLFTFDMFLVYKENTTHQWCGYQVNRVKFKRWLPNFDRLCSAELLNHKYMVPCDPITYLNREYGPSNWLTPEASNYTWTNVIYSRNWTDQEWPHTIKYYDKNGNLIKSKIVSYLNKHLANNISTIPPDDFD